MTLGVTIASLGLVLFLVPNKIAAGGASGFAIVIHHLFNFPIGLTMLLFNIPLFILAAKEMGFLFIFRTFYGTFALSFTVDFLGLILKPATTDPLLATVYGGVMLGLGIGIVIRAEGSVGGTELAARLLHRYTHMSIGQALMLIDTAIIVLVGIVFNLELALYGLLALFITIKVMDGIQEGFGYAKGAVIISEKSEDIAQRILLELGRGVTGLTGRGLYTGQGKEALLCVVNRTEITRLKAVVAEIDPEAFVILSDVKEVLGKGFDEHKF